MQCAIGNREGRQSLSYTLSILELLGCAIDGIAEFTNEPISSPYQSSIAVDLDCRWHATRTVAMLN
ncbi:hypothetical protein [Chamaesiphon sp. GL140_3_metabinner_50]|uniref:hypothetical protein n=1 Tax=Chamaesiphon sp. GL140_3_metabinner_50 TaxID=2970812 RepID=UPI0025E946A2|nr:hypothetical protein [Chamaesiphon sp. GL140_3_metabinner_50]